MTNKNPTVGEIWCMNIVRHNFDNSVHKTIKESFICILLEELTAHISHVDGSLSRHYIALKDDGKKTVLHTDDFNNNSYRIRG